MLSYISLSALFISSSFVSPLKTTAPPIETVILRGSFSYLNSDFSINHGNSNRYFYNFDLRNGHILHESDIFIDNYKAPLTELIKQRIVEDNAEIESVADLTEFDFWESEIKPNGNFYISDEGIVYVFNPYEIAPYSTGQTEVTLPYDRLKVLLKPGNLISYLYSSPA